MDAATLSSSSSSFLSSNTETNTKQSRQTQYQDREHQRHHHHRYYGDRFIPNRSAIDFDMARYLLEDARKGKENKKVASPLNGTYRKLLAEATMMDRTRILSFWRKPHAPTNGNFQENDLANRVKSSQQQRYIPKSADRTLDAPDLIDDYYLNLLDWSTRNILAIALKNKVYLWNASNGSCSVYDHLFEFIFLILLSSLFLQLTTLQGGHRGRVGLLSWNNRILTTGGSDSMIINNDVRMRSYTVQTYRGHCQEVCGLKWSNNGQHPMAS